MSSDELSIGVLHLGVKTRLLEEAGFKTVGDVKDVDPTVIMQIPMVGRRTSDELVTNRAALAHALGPEGAIDWQVYCAMAGKPLLPTTGKPASGSEFLECLPAFLRQLASQLNDEILTSILFDRICKPPGTQATLEEIGNAATPIVTRERVRQKEKKLLGQISGGLLNDQYDGLDVHFHPDFAHWWKLAADALSGLEEIEVATFVDLLSSVWHVPQSAVLEQLPALVAIVTGEPQMSVGFRSFASLDPRLFGEGYHKLRDLPVLKLRIGKAALRIFNAGFELTGAVIDGLKSGSIERAGGSAVKRVARHLNLIASCMSAGGDVDWCTYREAVGLACLPATPPATRADFVSGLAEATEALLRAHAVTARAGDIFQRRTGRDARERMTLQQTGDQLGTFPSSIKREETDLLVWLYDVLVGKEFWKLDVWLDAEWFKLWTEALEVFERYDEDYGAFADNLAWRWRLTVKEIRAAAPTLWAVFTGYPDRRRSGYSPPAPVMEAMAVPGRIRLQGFRRLH